MSFKAYQTNMPQANSWLLLTENGHMKCWDDSITDTIKQQ